MWWRLQNLLISDFQLLHPKASRYLKNQGAITKDHKWFRSRWRGHNETGGSMFIVIALKRSAQHDQFVRVTGLVAGGKRAFIYTIILSMQNGQKFVHAIRV